MLCCGDQKGGMKGDEVTVNILLVGHHSWMIQQHHFPLNYSGLNMIGNIMNKLVPF